jgi:hypothetical protein
VYTPDGSPLIPVAERDDEGGAGLDVITPTAGGGVVQVDETEVERLERQGYGVKILSEPNRLRVGAYDFDVTAERPPLPSSLRLSRAARADWPHHIVQLAGPPLPEFVAQLESVGVRVVRQVDRYAVAVVGDASAVEQAAALPAVVWADRFEPAFRVAAGLRDRRGTVPIAVGVYPAQRADDVAREMEAAGATVRTIERGETNAPRYARADRCAVVHGEVRAGSALNAIANLRDVQYIESDEPMQPEDERATQILAENFDAVPAPNTGPVTGYANTLTVFGIDGTGVTIGVIDTGIDNHASATLHQDLRGRLAFFADQTAGAVTVDGWLDASGQLQGGHGTHVAGIAAGDGATGDTDPGGFLLGQGVAPGARVGSVNYLAANPQPTADAVLQAAATNGSNVNNNSWGTPGPVGYNSQCTSIDQRVRDPDPNTAGLEEMCVVFSVGNSGGLPGSMTGPHEAKNAIVVGNGLTRRPGEGHQSDDIRGISDSSSRGPTADGRICPTVVAPGTDIVSALTTIDADPATTGVQRLYRTYTDTNGTNHANHTSLSGSSMAAPHVSGLCALLVEWWRDRTGATPSAAMLRALLINGAEDMAGGPSWKRLVFPGMVLWVANGANFQRAGLGFQPAQVWGWGSGQALTQFTQRNTVAQIANAGEWSYAAGTDTLTVRTLNGARPDGPTTVAWDRVMALDTAVITNIPNNDQGWGRVSLRNIVATAPASDRGPKIFSDQRIAFTANGQSHRIRVAPVDTARPMRITLCWTDPPGTTLVNDLDLIVTQVGGPTFRGNRFTNGFSVAGGVADDTNNTECVYVQNPIGVYDVDVIASSITTDARDFTLGSPWQDYAIVIDNAQVPAANPVSVATVLDRSGSMIWSGYVARTVQASSQFVDLMSIDDAVGVVSFGTTADVAYPGGANPGAVTITGDAERNGATAAIGAINFGGATAMGPGITSGAALLSGSAGTKALVLLSDGYDNGTPDAATAVAALPSDVTLYSCAMGPASDQALLEQLATSAGGRFYYMPTIDDLFEIYNWIRGRVTGTGVIANETSAASRSRVGAFVDACAVTATFTAAWPDPTVTYTSRDPRTANEVSVRLRAPNGKLLAPTNSTVRTVVGSAYVVFEVDQPAPGQWFVEVETLRNAHLPYTVGGFVTSDVSTELTVQPSPALPGQPLTIGVGASEAGSPIGDLRATVCVRGPRWGRREVLDRHTRLLRRRIRSQKGDAVPSRFVDLVTMAKLLQAREIDLAEQVEQCFDLKSGRVERPDFALRRPLLLRGVPRLTGDVQTVGPVTADPFTLTTGPATTPTTGVIGRVPPATTITVPAGTAAAGLVPHTFTNTKLDGTYNVIATIQGRSRTCGEFVRHEFVSVRVGKPTDEVG